jgi:zinc protease
LRLVRISFFLVKSYMALNSVDSQSWDKILQGDTQQFGELVELYKNLISGIAYSTIGDLQGSEDIAQEAFLVAWQSRSELRNPYKLAGWLSSITRNLAKQWVRQRRSKSWPTPNHDEIELQQANQAEPVDRLVSEEEQLMVWSSLETIPETYREVLVLYYRYSNSIAEVAQALDLTEEAARQRLSRGRSLLRAEVERKIETALIASRPKANFTAEVLSALAATGWLGPTAAKAASLASSGLLSKLAANGAAGSASTAASGAILGAAGGTAGVIGGLGGAWLGIRVPQLLAPTMTERKLLEREGRIIWRVALVYALLVLATMVTAFILHRVNINALAFSLITNFVLTVVFSTFCIVRSIQIGRIIRQVRSKVRPEDDPNPNWLKQRMGVAAEPASPKWLGRRVTSSREFLGWPVYDFQVSDPGWQVGRSTAAETLHAKGWIAVGDRATGLIAVGNSARGILAVGGRAIGLVAVGGLSLGLISIGGLAMGLLALGGLAIGHSAVGGAAIGWQSVGGAAIGIYSANGGLAIAGTIADGGLAISREFAIGGGANAPEANTETARAECRKSWAYEQIGSDSILKDIQAFRQRVMIYGTLLPLGVAVVLSGTIVCLMYRRGESKERPPATKVQ